MRRKFVVHILKYEGNEALNNIPAMERSIIDDILRWNFMKKKSIIDIVAWFMFSKYLGNYYNTFI
jgi:hypothetical protein